MVLVVIWLLFSLVSVICLLVSAITASTWFPVVGVQLKVIVVDSPAASPVSVIFCVWVLLSYSLTVNVLAVLVPVLLMVALTW